MDGRIGNRFWEGRGKHGVDPTYATPGEIWTAFQDYAKWTQENPLWVKDWKGKDAVPVDIPKPRAMSKIAFALHCGLCAWEVINRYRDKGNDFNEVISQIENCIVSQKFELGAAELLNPQFIARDLGMRDQQEQTVNSTHSLAPGVAEELARLMNKNAG